MSNIIGVRNNNTIVPYQSATKRTKQLTLTATPTADWTTSDAIGIAYADSAGNWRLVFNITGYNNSNKTAETVLTITGVAFRNNSLSGQGVGLAMFNAVDAPIAGYAYAQDNAATIIIGSVGAANYNRATISGDVALASEPTWAAANMEGVIAADVYIAPATKTVGGVLTLKAPTQTVYVTGTSQAYTVPSGVLYLKVRMVGGGGGGSGSSNSASSNAGAGGNGGITSFAGGSTTLTANGGTGAAANNLQGANNGGSASLAGASGVAFAGQPGGGGSVFITSNWYQAGACGGSTVFGGGGVGSVNTAGFNAATNSGGGGGGGGLANAASTYHLGGGGGAGGYVDALISTLETSYTYSIGAAGTAGGAGASGYAGGVGGAGIIIIEEHYY